MTFQVGLADGREIGVPDKEDALCIESLRLFADSFRGSFAIDDTINCRKVV
jgi:hypothetical protein